MIVIRRKILGKFHIYTVEEANEKGINYKEKWYEGDKGDWVKTSDNYVTQVLRKYFIKKNKNMEFYRLQFPFGFIWIWYKDGVIGKDFVCNVSDYLKARAFNRNAPITYGASIVKSKKWKYFFATYAKLLVEGRLNEETFEHLANRFCKKHTKPALRLKVVLRQKEVKKKLEEEIIKRMAKMGIEDPKSYAVNLLKKAAEIAEKDRNPEAMIKVAKEFNLLLDAYPKKLTVTEQLQLVSTKKLIDNIEEEEKKLLTIRSENDI